MTLHDGPSRDVQVLVEKNLAGPLPSDELDGGIGHLLAKKECHGTASP
jgi:hypothetical protein